MRNETITFTAIELRQREQYRKRMIILWIICLVAACAFAFWYALTAEMEYRKPAFNALQMSDSQWPVNAQHVAKGD